MNIERKKIDENTWRWVFVAQDSNDDNQLRSVFGGLDNISQTLPDGSTFTLTQQIDSSLNKTFLSVFIERKKLPIASLRPTLPAKGSPRHDKDYACMNHEQLIAAAKREKVTIHQGENDEVVRERLAATVGV